MTRCSNCEKISNCPYGVQDYESIFITNCDEFSFDLAEHDKQIREEVVDLIDRHMWNYSHEVWEDFKPILEQLKGAENE